MPEVNCVFYVRNLPKSFEEKYVLQKILKSGYVGGMCPKQIFPKCSELKNHIKEY